MRIIHKQHKGHTYLSHSHFRFKITLSTYIITGLVLGIVAGIFLGSRAAPLSQIGRTCVDLLQMGVIPFIVVSLICGLGEICGASLKRLLISFGLSSIAMWLLFFITAVALYMTFPSIEQHSLYKFSKAAEKPLSEMFVPENPFHAMAEGFVPAVVVFFIALGIAIIPVKNKKPFLESMNTLLQALLKLNSFMVNLVPIIVFCYTANLVGNSNMTVEKLLEFQVFLLSAFLGCIITFFFIVPLLVVTFTDIGYYEFMREFKHIVITAMLTANTIIMIPMIIDKLEELSKKHKIEGEGNTSVIHTSITVGFNITGPSMIPTVIFILFASWFIGEDVSMRLPGIFVYAVTTLFGGQTFSVIALLDFLHLPPDMLGIYMTFQQLYLVNIIAAIKQPFLAALALICVFVNVKRESFKILPFLRLAVIGVTSIAITLIGLSIYYKDTVKGNPNAFASLVDKMVLESPVPVTVENTTPKLTHGEEFNTLEDIVNNKEIVFAYKNHFEPFTFKNSKGELMGFMTALVERLAASLNCSVKFVPVDNYQITMELLKSGDIDLAFYEFNIDDIDHLLNVGYSDPILYLQSGLVVHNSDRNIFSNWKNILNNPSITIAISSLYPLNHILENEIKKANKAKIVYVDQFTLKDIPNTNFPAYFTSAERGLFFCLEYPKYSFIMPDGIPSINQNTLIFMTNPKNNGLLYYINYWLKIQKEGDNESEVQKLYEYWIEGKIEKD
ncbi:MAG TPA: hypothetical protein DD381_05830 [Lentisphaeria bacterium]|nr:MAG: hypothetical protein A2X47_08280 [Lentisphaerae bacterium GWF2_38_69]HBM15845.1 hypothetical protein [Lentisphaeria bacterium]